MVIRMCILVQVWCVAVDLAGWNDWMCHRRDLWVIRVDPGGNLYVSYSVTILGQDTGYGIDAKSGVFC